MKVDISLLCCFCNYACVSDILVHIFNEGSCHLAQLFCFAECRRACTPLESANASFCLHAWRYCFTRGHFESEESDRRVNYFLVANWTIEISLGGLQMVLIHPGFYEMVLIHPRLIHVTLPYGVVVFQIHLTTGLVCASTVLRIFHGCWLLMFLVSSFTTCFTLTVQGCVVLRLIFICSGMCEAYGFVFKLVHISWMVGDCVSSARVHVIVLRFNYVEILSIIP